MSRFSALLRTGGTFGSLSLSHWPGYCRVAELFRKKMYMFADPLMSSYPQSHVEEKVFFNQIASLALLSIISAPPVKHLLCARLSGAGMCCLWFSPNSAENAQATSLVHIGKLFLKVVELAHITHLQASSNLANSRVHDVLLACHNHTRF